MKSKGVIYDKRKVWLKNYMHERDNLVIDGKGRTERHRMVWRVD